MMMTVDNLPMLRGRNKQLNIGLCLTRTQQSKQKGLSFKLKLRRTLVSFWSQRTSFILMFMVNSLTL